jgi:S-adenosylmethionine:tRNA ribosyltransferase-isomerase
VEILIERLLPDNAARAQLGVSKPPQVGSRIALDAGGEAEVLAREEGGFWRLRFHVGEALEQWLLHAGRMPLPPYIQREPGADDDERYQTVFARAVGAVAAPTAGLHFDEALLDALRERGVHFGHVTLHVGAGTFQPVRVDDIREHRMHSEWLNVGAELVRQVRRTRAAGGRVVAVGTTVVRALETVADVDGVVRPASGWTQLVLGQRRRARVVSGLISGLHAPGASHLQLLEAVAGHTLVEAAYVSAVGERYRWHEFGDSTLFLPDR